MCWGRVTMLVLCFVVLCIVRAAARASSVEVFFIDPELVDDEFDGSRGGGAFACGRRRGR